MSFVYYPSTNLGWECPKCGGCFAPAVQQCTNCPGNYATTTFTVTCTCGKLTSSKTCPVHDSQWSYTNVEEAETLERDKFTAEEFYGDDGYIRVAEADLPLASDATYDEPAPECGCTGKRGPCPKIQ